MKKKIFNNNLTKIKLLDCTLRDGGYYNQWNFKKEVVKKYLNDLHKASIDIIELGFRFPQKKPFYGPFAYTKDSFLKKIRLPKKIKYAVMINASDFFKNEKNIKKEINNIFKKKKIFTNINCQNRC